MKNFLTSLLSGVLILAACVPTIAESTPLPPPSAMPTIVPLTSTPSLTPIPPTQTITPLPTIPTFTPTFDASTIVTVTPAAKAECPKIDSAIKPETYLPKKIEYPAPHVPDKIIEFLNSGGNGQSLVKKLDQIYSKVEYSGGYTFLDVTGDQIPEFLYVELYYGERPIVFSCKNGKYEILDVLSGRHNFDFYEMDFEDLNTDGIPEIIVTGTGGASFPISTIYIYEWNGRIFSILGQVHMLALRQMQIRDTDGNGTKEIILSGDNPGCLSCSNFVPQRERTVILSWNGKNFVEILNEFEAPEYRFQAIQDADNMVIIGKYGKAVQLYGKAILNKNLEWWSSERLKYEQALADSWIPDLTLPPEPSKDQTEYPRLAAYAYYRILLLHIAQEHESDAGTVYKMLQQKFGDDPHGRPYVEMATAFWDSYQSTHKMYNGCAAAIQYAAEHPEILIPLGSDYHGSQSHTYVPADVCPFR